MVFQALKMLQVSRFKFAHTSLADITFFQVIVRVSALTFNLMVKRKVKIWIVKVEVWM